MIIDSHAHSCGTFLNADNIISELDKNQIDKVILVPGELNNSKNYSLPNIAKLLPNRDVIKITNIVTKQVIKFTVKINDIEKGNEYVHSLVKQYPERVIQFYWFVVNSPKALLNLEKNYELWGFKGIKVHQCWESFSYRSNIFKDVAKFASSHDLPIFVHSYSYKDINDLIGFAEKNPSTKIIVGHLFGLKEFINFGLKLSNIYFEISTPQLVSRERLLAAIDHFGADRILFGSDVPYGRDNQRLNIERINSLDISEDDKAKILGNNIKELIYL